MQQELLGNTSLVQIDDNALSQGAFLAFVLAEQNILHVAAQTSQGIAANLSHNTVHYYGSLSYDVTNYELSREDSLWGRNENAPAYGVTINAVVDSSPFPWIEPTTKPALSTTFSVGETTFDMLSSYTATAISVLALRSAFSISYFAAPEQASHIAENVVLFSMPRSQEMTNAVSVIQRDIALAPPSRTTIKMRGRVRRIFSTPPTASLSDDEWNSFRAPGESVD